MQVPQNTQRSPSSLIAGPRGRIATPGQYHSDVMAGRVPSIPSIITKNGSYQSQVSNRVYDSRRPKPYAQFDARKHLAGGSFQNIIAPLRSSGYYGDHVQVGHDAVPRSLFFARELIHMIPTMLQVEFTAINARSIIPVYFAGDPGAQTVNWRQTEGYGRATIISKWGQQIPTAEAKSEEFDQRVRSLAVAIQMNIQEQREAQKANAPLVQQKMTAARMAMLREENRLAWNGDETFNVRGFLSESVAGGQQGPARLPSPVNFLDPNTTASDMLEALHGLPHWIVDNSDGVEVPDFLGLPTAQFNVAATKRLSDTTGETVLQAFVRNNQYINSVARVNELAGAGIGGTDVAICFNRSLDKVRLNVMLDLEMFPPTVTDGETRIVFHMRTGGVTWHRPNSGVVYEGV